MYSRDTRQRSHIPEEPRNTGWTFFGEPVNLVARWTKRCGDFHLPTYIGVYATEATTTVEK